MVLVIIRSSFLTIVLEYSHVKSPWLQFLNSSCHSKKKKSIFWDGRHLSLTACVHPACCENYITEFTILGVPRKFHANLGWSDALLIKTPLPPRKRCNTYQSSNYRHDNHKSKPAYPKNIYSKTLKVYRCGDSIMISLDFEKNLVYIYMLIQLERLRSIHLVDKTHQAQ